MTDSAVLPQHIAIIMDGNRRWAKKHKMQVLQGHEYVANKVIEQLVLHCIKLEIPYLTLWAFSTENWHRDQKEVMGLMNLFRSAFSKNAEKLHKLGVKLNYIGDLSKFPEDIQRNVIQWCKDTKNNQKITVTFALNYGGRNELVRGVNRVLGAGYRVQGDKQGSGSKVQGEVTEEMIAAALDTAGMPDPDMIIRPGGEQRLSGLMPWQAVYAELYFTDVLMPDFGPDELDKAVAEYSSRQRRFGT